MTANKSNVVYLNEEYARMREAEDILKSRIALERDRAVGDFEYAQAMMELQIREIAWAKRWQIK